MDLCDTTTDVSSIGETRRGHEGKNWDANFGVGMVCILGRDFGTVFEDPCECPPRGESGPSDNRESVSMHASRSLSDMVLGLHLVPLFDRGICVTNEMGSGRTGGG